MAAVDLSVPRHHPSFVPGAGMTGHNGYSDHDSSSNIISSTRNSSNSEVNSGAKGAFDSASPSAPRNSVPFPYRLSNQMGASNGSLADFAAVIVCVVWFEDASKLDEILMQTSSSSSTPITAPNSQVSSPVSTPMLHPDSRPTDAFRSWLASLFQTTRVSRNVVLAALLYIYRLKLANSDVRGKKGSEYRLITVALMMGNKYLDDNTYTNKTWADISGIDCAELHIMEIEFLSNVRYHLFVSQRGWAEWQKKLCLLYTYYSRCASAAFTVAGLNYASNPFYQSSLHQAPLSPLDSTSSSPLKDRCAASMLPSPPDSVTCALQENQSACSSRPISPPTFSNLERKRIRDVNSMLVTDPLRHRPDMQQQQLQVPYVHRRHVSASLPGMVPTSKPNPYQPAMLPERSTYPVPQDPWQRYAPISEQAAGNPYPMPQEPLQRYAPISDQAPILPPPPPPAPPATSLDAMSSNGSFSTTMNGSQQLPGNPSLYPALMNRPSYGARIPSLSIPNIYSQGQPPNLPQASHGQRNLHNHRQSLGCPSVPSPLSPTAVQRQSLNAARSMSNMGSNHTGMANGPSMTMPPVEQYYSQLPLTSQAQQQQHHNNMMLGPRSSSPSPYHSAVGVHHLLHPYPTQNATANNQLPSLPTAVAVPYQPRPIPLEQSRYYPLSRAPGQSKLRTGALPYVPWEYSTAHNAGMDLRTGCS